MDPDGLCTLIHTLVRQGLPIELKNAKVVVIGKPGKRDLTNPKSYRCISLLSNIAKLTENIIAQYLTLEGESNGWWHRTQFGSRPGRNTSDALMWLKSEVAKNRRQNMNTALIMTDVAAAFPGTQPSTVLRTLAPLIDPLIYRWIQNWFTNRSISMTLDGLVGEQTESRCWIPQGSRLSPVLFGLVCASTLQALPEGSSYVDDCSWAIPFSSPRQLQRDSSRLLDAVKEQFEGHGLLLDTGKLEVAFISKNTRTSKRFREESKKWKVEWGGKILTLQGTTRWLGFYLDPFLNWRSHVQIRIQQALFRQQRVSRFMQQWGIKRQLARTVAWSTSMSTGAYGIEGIWEGQPWIVNEFHRLTARIGQDVAGTLRSTKKDDAIREAGTPPTRAALDRRTDRHFIRLVSNSVQHPCQSYIEGWDQLDDEPDTMDSWLRRSSEGWWSRGQKIEHTTPVPILYTPWIDRSSGGAETDTGHEVHLYTDGSYRETAGYGWTLRDSKGYEVNCGSGSLGKNQTAYDAEVAAIEEGIKAVSKSQQAFNHLSIFADSTSAIARVKHNKTGPGQSRATKVIRHIQRLKAQGKTTSRDWVQGHNNDPGNDRADELAGQAAELPPPLLANAVSIAWMRQTVSDQYSATANIELRETGKHTITPPPPKKSALDKGPNSEARAVAQLRTNHWVSGVYLKRIKKRSHDGCWFCEPSHNSQDTPRMTRTHVLLRCVAFEEFRRETWTDPLTGEFTRPSSIGQSWLRRSSEGLWSRGQKIEHTTPLPILYTPWIDRSSGGAETDTGHEVHLYTDGSYRETAGYGWTLRDSKGYEINCGSGSLGKNQTAYDAEVAAIEEGIKAVSKSQQAFKHLSIFSDSTSAIARVKHNKTGPGQSRATKVIRHIQRLKAQGKTASIDWVQGHNNNPGNDRADELAGQAAELPPPRLANAVSIAWMRQTVSDQYTATANIELRETGKHTITPPPPKKSALDKGPNSEARAVAQLRTNHWVSGVYLKRIKKRSHDGCWFCEPSHNSQDTPRMTRTHVLLRCVAFEEFRRETWTDPLTGEFTRPSSIGQLLGNPRWEKRLLKFLQRTKIGRIGPDLIDDEVRRVTRYEGWTDLVPDERSIDRGEQVADHILDTIVVRQT
jgi:ribonuclease HI